jgi:hypothetical protein
LRIFESRDPIRRNVIFMAADTPCTRNRSIRREAAPLEDLPVDFLGNGSAL